MLYFLYGTDTDKARAKASELVASLRQKRPDAEVFALDPERLTEGELAMLAEGRGLFSPRSVVYGNGIFALKEAKAAFLSKLSSLAASENVFIIVEELIDAKTLARVRKHAEKVQEFSRGAAPAPDTFNIFSIADAFGRRDRMLLFALFAQALKGGAAPEEIHGVLFWQLKSMLLSASAGSPSAAGLKPFVYARAKRYAGNYRAGELGTLSGELVSLYHDAHRGRFDLAVALERFILSL